MNLQTLIEELPGKVAGAVTAALRPPAGPAAQPAGTSGNEPVRRQAPAPKSDGDSGLLDQINAISDPLSRAKFIAKHRDQLRDARDAQRHRQHC